VKAARTYTGAALAHVCTAMARFLPEGTRVQVAKDVGTYAFLPGTTWHRTFLKLDLISCCNVLIYLEDVLQPVVSISEASSQGFLILGPTEASHVFRVISSSDKAHKSMLGGRCTRGLR